MFRLLTLLAVSAGLMAVLAPDQPTADAAPVPMHLMPKVPAFPYPTAVGTKWVYSTAGGQDSTFVVSAVEDKDGGKLVTIEIEFAGGVRAPLRKMKVTSSAWSMTEEVNKPFTPDWVKVKPPSDREQKWAFAVSRSDFKSPLKGMAVQPAGTEKMKTPAGVFDCVRVEEEWAIGDGNTVKTTFWYAPGVGLVKMGGNFELKEFTPEKGN